MKLVKIAMSFAVIAMLAGSSALAQGPGRGGPGGPGGGGRGPGPGGPAPRPPGGPVYGSPVTGTPVGPGPRPPGGPVYGSPVTGRPVGPGPRPQPQPPIPGPYRPQPGPAPFPQPQPGRPPQPGPYRPAPPYQPAPPPYHPQPRPPVFNNPPPVFHFPTYPVYGSFPAGPCTIYANNAFNSFYTISNAYNQNIVSTYDYAQATQIAQNALNARECSYVTTVTNNYSAPNYCQIEPGANAYGQAFYNVVAGSGAILDSTPNYQQALNDVQSDVQCYQ